MISHQLHRVHAQCYRVITIIDDMTHDVTYDVCSDFSHQEHARRMSPHRNPDHLFRQRIHHQLHGNARDVTRRGRIRQGYFAGVGPLNTTVFDRYPSVPNRVPVPSRSASQPDVARFRSAQSVGRDRKSRGRCDEVLLQVRDRRRASDRKQRHRLRRRTAARATRLPVSLKSRSRSTAARKSHEISAQV